MKEKYKVLIVHNYYQIPGGEDTVIANEKKMLENHGHEVILYSRNNSEIKELRRVQKLLLPFTMIFNFRTYKDIRSIIKEKSVDIIHVHNTLNLVSPAVYYVARTCKVPVIQTIHNFRLLCPGATFYRNGHICEDCVTHGIGCAVKHRCYRGSKLQTLACVISTKFHRMTGIYGKINYICLTEFNKEKLLQLKQIPSKNIFVKPNFVVSTGSIIPKNQRQNQFVFVGRLDALKGVDILLEAWKRMGTEAPKLLICGTGPMEEWCKSYIAENILISVTMKGFVPNTEVREIIANSKALVLPTQWYEGFPMSIAEAFAVGTPVVCSDLGNAGSLVSEGITGAKFTADSPKELVRAVNRLLDYEDIYQSTYGTYKRLYSEGKNYECLMEVYQKAQIS